MIAALRQFVQNVIVVMLLGTFLQMILPEGNIRRYAQLAVGLIMVLVLVTPLVQLSRGQLDFGVVLSQATTTVAWEELQLKGQVWQEQNEQTLLMSYRQALTEQVKHLAERSGEAMLQSCQVDLVEQRQAEDFGRILAIRVQLSRGQGLVQAVTALRPIQVGEAEVELHPGSASDTAAEAAAIQSVLANHFGLDPEQVSVTIK